MPSRIRQRLTALLRAATVLPRTIVAPRRSPPRLRFVYVEMGASTRYRVQHHLEQAQIAGFVADAMPLDDSRRLYDLAQTDLIYVHRLPLAALTLPLVIAARLRRIPLVFDADDLVWDEREREYSFLDRHHDPHTVDQLLKQARHNRMLMRLSDALVCSTPYLARLAADLRRPTFVSPNVLSREQLVHSQAAYDTRCCAPPPESPVIGYFCGYAHVHDEDVATIGPALAAALETCPAARLRIYGEVTLPPHLDAPPFAGRIERRPVVNWRELPQHIAGIDVNIAPLVDNPQRRGKSAIKYLEAAAVGVPTVAARMEPYRDAVVDGASGFLATTHEEWVAALTRLLADSELRRRMGKVARAHVLAEHTTECQAARFAGIIARIAAPPARGAQRT